MGLLEKLGRLSPVRKTIEFDSFNYQHFLTIVLIMSFSRSLAWIAYLLGTRLKTVADYYNFPLFGSENVNRIINSATFYGDFSWYMSIATSGYTVKPFDMAVQTNWAFFPLMAWIGSIIESPNSRFVAGIVCFLTGLVFVHRVSSRFVDNKSAMFTISLIAFWPGSYVLSQFRPEAVLFTFSAMAIYFSICCNFIPALLTLLVTSFAKPNGFLLLFLLLPIVAGADEIRNKTNAKLTKWLRLGAMGLAGIAGPLYVSAVSLQTSGNPLAWIKIQAAWGAASNRPWLQFKQLLTDPLIIGRWGWDFELFNWFVVVLGIVAVKILANKRQYVFSAYVGLYQLMTFLNFGNWVFMRHMAACVPLFIALAQISNENARQLLIAACAIIFGALMVVSGSGYIPGLF